ncbi:hypothetical protein CFIO01_13440 [Colletotrichum fioriniae PJ7]|uniref:Phospholipid-binding protein n=1 Tax=Colletotrichum fioriniae PJ7 TaxID=1445577 RepID=A0A010RVA0_9PEZI|nr:hypothetical protein CFIO01_13440 [Colletotrichum fioriniae PJ7]
MGPHGRPKDASLDAPDAPDAPILSQPEPSQVPTGGDFVLPQLHVQSHTPAHSNPEAPRSSSPPKDTILPAAVVITNRKKKKRNETAPRRRKGEDHHEASESFKPDDGDTRRTRRLPPHNPNALTTPAGPRVASLLPRLDREPPLLLPPAPPATAATRPRRPHKSAKAYRIALASLSTAASAFGSALESCARLKEARAESLSGGINGLSGGGGGGGGGGLLSASFTAGGPKGSCTADLLLSASGVHHLVANHQQILSETVYRDFEVPLLHELDQWRQRVDDEEEAYVREVKARNAEIRKLEKEGLKLHKQRRRDVGKFRAHLVDLTTRLDGLTSLHGEHARTLLRESQDTSGRILESSCSLVRAEVDIFESLARKGWSGGGLDELLEKGADLFASDEVGDHSGLGSVIGGGVGGGGGSAETAKLFSILPPKSILADAASDMTRRGGHARGDSLLSDPERYQSLAAAAGGPSPGFGGDDNDTDSIFSETNFNRPRGVRPFSPQPIRRHATDVTFDSLGVGLSEESRGEDDKTPEDEVEQRRHDVLKEEDEGDTFGERPNWGDEPVDSKSTTERGEQKEGEEGDSAAVLGDTAAVEDITEQDGAAIASGSGERGRPGRRWSVNEDDA